MCKLLSYWRNFKWHCTHLYKWWIRKTFQQKRAVGKNCSTLKSLKLAINFIYLNHMGLKKIQNFRINLLILDIRGMYIKYRECLTSGMIQKSFILFEITYILIGYLRPMVISTWWSNFIIANLKLLINCCFELFTNSCSS